jgi:hypothetical protein
MIDTPWIAPNASALAHLEQEALDRLRQNSPILTLACNWQLGHSVLTWTLFGIGVFITLRQDTTRFFAVALLLLLAYFLLTVMVVGCEAYCRSRTPHMPLVFALAGAGAANLRLPFGPKRVPPQAGTPVPPH